MFSGLICVSPPLSRSRTLQRPPAPYCLTPIQGTRIRASPCHYPCSREALIAQNPLAQPIGQLLQGSPAIKRRVRNVRRLQLVFQIEIYERDSSSTCTTPVPNPRRNQDSPKLAILSVCQQLQ